MFERLLSSDRQLFGTLAGIAAQLTEAARLLRQLLAHPSLLDQHAAAIKVVERESDRVTHDLHVRLDTVFIPPIDREDVHLLASRLDDVVELIGDTARRARDFQIGHVQEPVLRLADVLIRAGERLEDAVARVKDSAFVLERCRDVKRLEAEGDAIYAEAVSALFAGHPDPLEVMKWKELYDHLEDALDGCHYAATALEHITLKHA